MAVSIKLSSLADYAAECFQRAKKAAEERNLPGPVAKSLREGRVVKMSMYAAEAQMMTDDPAFNEIERFDGMRAWGAFLSFDLRRSSRRALEIGPKDTYITMHTLLPTMLKIINTSGGTVVGLRGDGALAMFGVVRYENGVTNATSLQAEQAVTQSCDCGAAMVTAVERVVNPILAEGKVRADLKIGVGIDVGEFVATRIGIERAYELTAYGDCVNKACHRADHGHNRVVVTNDVRRMFPTTPGGKTAFTGVPDQTDAYYLNYPADYHAIR